MHARRSLPYFYEGLLESDRDYDDPTADVDVRVLLTSPSGAAREVRAFWDGGRVWRFRVDAAEPGEWTCALRCSDDSQDGWIGREASFVVRPYAGNNPLYRHGPLRVASAGTHLEHADGTPFFWLADTAWNGVLKAQPRDWEHYLSTRAEQGFTAIQSVLTDWRAFPADDESERAFTGTENIAINPAFFRRLDAKVAAISAHGLAPVLVVLWALTQRDPGHFLREADAIRLARYVVARYAAFRPVWFLGGDGRYYHDVDRWRRIGRAVFPDDEERALVTLHPCGRSWIGEDFRAERWFDFIGYQSSHGATTFDWTTGGEPATHWANKPQLPVINLEPCYEGHRWGGTDQMFSSREARIAMFQSLLVSPTAGVTYGNHSIWPWLERHETGLDHYGAGAAPAWHEALSGDGAASCTALAYVFVGLEWWKLEPAPGMVVVPAEEAADELEGVRRVVAARANDASFAMVYLPEGGRVRLLASEVPGLEHATWYDPRTGRGMPAAVTESADPTSAGPASDSVYDAPTEHDWLLLLRR